MRHWFAATLLLAAVLAASPAAADEPGFEAALGDFRQLHRAEMRRAGIAGSSFTFVRDGRIVAADYLGEQDADAHVPVDARTIYHWASITKTMTGIAIMQLRDRGLLSLDDPITRYVPELARVHNPLWRHGGDHDPAADEPQRRLSRTAPGPGATRNGSRSSRRAGRSSRRCCPIREVEFRPGSRFSYSNPGIVYLGQVIERLTGEDFEVYVDKNILRPLGMHASYFDRTPPHSCCRIARTLIISAAAGGSRRRSTSIPG